MMKKTMLQVSMVGLGKGCQDTDRNEMCHIH